MLWYSHFEAKIANFNLKIINAIFKIALPRFSVGQIPDRDWVAPSLFAPAPA